MSHFVFSLFSLGWHLLTETAQALSLSPSLLTLLVGVTCLPLSQLTFSVNYFLD